MQFKELFKEQFKEKFKEKFKEQFKEEHTGRNKKEEEINLKGFREKLMDQTRGQGKQVERGEHIDQRDAQGSVKGSRRAGRARGKY